MASLRMNMQHSLIQGFMIYEFEPSHNADETARNICCDERWSGSWQLYKNQIIQKSSPGLQDPKEQLMLLTAIC